MNHFFDLGYHRGQGLQKATQELGIDDSWKIHIFEPNPISAKRIPKGPNIIKNSVAAWIRDEQLTIHMEHGWGGEKDGWGSSVMEDWEFSKVNKADWEHQKCYGVDFVRYIKDNTAPDDEVHIKMDIEGAEYPVLRDMLEEDEEFWDRIKTLDVEFHHRFLPKESKETTESLIKVLRDRTWVTIHG